MRRKIVSILLCVGMVLSLAACGSKESNEKTGGQESTMVENEEDLKEVTIIEPNYEGIETAANGARVSIHDPSIKVYNGKYYIYGSHMTGAVSDDMQTWKYIGNGYDSNNALFSDFFEEGLGIFDYSGDYGNGSYAVWAEDMIYIEEMQKYVMYFCTSSTYIKIGRAHV